MTMSNKRSAIDLTTIPVHPAAAKLPMMTEDELDALAKDIKENGLVEPITLWEDNREAAKGAKGPFTTYLLDGRNRLEALKRLGAIGRQQPKKSAGALYGGSAYYYRILPAVTEGFGLDLSTGQTTASTWRAGVDPVVYVLSTNVRRRHLNEAQMRQAIIDYRTVDPTASNRKVATVLGVDHKTVAKAVRDSAPNGESPQMAHLPVERAKAVLTDQPDLSNRAAAKAAGVGETTIRRTRQELAKPVLAVVPDVKEKPMPKVRAGAHDKAMKEIVDSLSKIDPAGLSKQGRVSLEKARQQFYRIEDGLDEKGAM